MYRTAVVPGLYRYTSSVLFYSVIMQKLELQLFIYCVSLSFLLRKEACLSKPNLELNRKEKSRFGLHHFFQHFLTVPGLVYIFRMSVPESAIYARSLGTFLLQKVFESHIWVLGTLTAAGSLFPCLPSGQSQEIHAYT